MLMDDDFGQAMGKVYGEAMKFMNEIGEQIQTELINEEAQKIYSKVISNGK
jgi:hypothetical protein